MFDINLKSFQYKKETKHLVETYADSVLWFVDKKYMEHVKIEIDLNMEDNQTPDTSVTIYLYMKSS